MCETNHVYCPINDKKEKEKIYQKWRETQAEKRKNQDWTYEKNVKKKEQLRQSKLEFQRNKKMEV